MTLGCILFIILDLNKITMSPINTKNITKENIKNNINILLKFELLLLLKECVIFMLTKI